ncbi:MAG: DUF1028 domain-containing protein [bacterium]|nr:DUF1028 domain-containing protein [bacterium]
MKLSSGSLRRFTCLALAGVVLAAEASATWSIVVVNRATREVGIASATCISGNFRLRRWTPVVRVGIGAGAAQSFVDTTGTNRLRIWNGLIAGETPQVILDALAAQDPSHQTRQYGIASFDGPAVTFTGTGAGAGVCGITGEVGDLVYAIQGNVITGEPVCLDAEAALLGAPGDLGQKIMAAMEAARRRGGDGRCSCQGGAPDSCGSPPDDFVKTAHTGYVLLARVGDPDANACTTGLGCALGDYYLQLEDMGTFADPDPVSVMQDAYDQWRLSKIGLTDQILSEVETDVQQLVADGTTQARVIVRLNDIDGNPVTATNLSVVPVPASGQPIAGAAPATHLGGNEWALDFTATTTPGRASYNISVTNGTDSIRLYPPLHLESDPVTSLHSTRWNLSAATGGSSGLVINMGVQNAAAPYHIYGSFSGNVPGTPVGGVMLPLNRDRLFDLTEGNPTHPTLTDFIGNLDVDGRAEAAIAIRPMLLVPIIGGRIDFAATIGTGPGVVVTDLARLDVVR